MSENESDTTTDFTAQARVFEQIRVLVDVHDGDREPVGPYTRCNQQKKAQGIAMAFADIERLGWDEGDVVYPSKELRLSAGGMWRQIRVVCECQELNAENITADDHAQPIDAEIVEVDSEKVAERQRKRELVTV